MITRANAARAAQPAQDAAEAPQMHNNPLAEVNDGDLSPRSAAAEGEPSASLAGEGLGGTPRARSERSLLAPVEKEVIKIVHCFISEMESTSERTTYSRVSEFVSAMEGPVGMEAVTQAATPGLRLTESTCARLVAVLAQCLDTRVDPALSAVESMRALLVDLPADVAPRVPSPLRPEDDHVIDYLPAPQRPAHPREAALRNFAAAYTPSRVAHIAPTTGHLVDLTAHQYGGENAFTANHPGGASAFEVQRAFASHCKLLLRYQKGSNMADFIAYLKADAEKHGFTSEDQLYQMAGQVFPHNTKAAKVVADCRLRNTKFADAVKHLLAEYQPRSQEVVNRLASAEYVQLSSESVTVFFDRIVALLNTYNVRESDIDTSMLNLIIANLRHEQLRVHIAVKQRESNMTWLDVRSFAITMDAAMSSARNRAPAAESRRAAPHASSAYRPFERRESSTGRDPDRAVAHDRDRYGGRDSGKPRPEAGRDSRTVRFSRVENRPATPRHQSQSPGRSRSAERAPRPSSSRSPSADSQSRTVACITVPEDEDLIYC